MPEEGFKAPFARKSIGIDVAKYQAMIDDPDLDEEQKRQFVEALWRILICFVDLGFELHPSNIACGQLAKNGSKDCETGLDVLNFDEILTNTFEHAASGNGQRGGKESDEER